MRLKKLPLIVLDNDHPILTLPHAGPNQKSEHGEMSNPKFQIKLIDGQRTGSPLHLGLIGSVTSLL
jgi:hypothetical protein